jgi:hypothetical protein
VPANLNGKLADPTFRKNRARKAARARTTVDHHIQALVDAAPPLTSEQRDKLAAVLRPTSHASVKEAA